MHVVAIIAAYNERRFIEACLAHLDRHGVDAYLIDNCSTDTTVELAERWLDRNLIGIESFPRGENDVYNWRELLRRKEQLAAKLEADWFMHLDPDEIRLPPSRDATTLREAFETVDREGFNAVDFAEFTFVPTREHPDHDHPRFEDTMRAYYTFQPRRGPHQLKAWKAQLDVKLASGGHRVEFEGQKIWPKKFRMKHYLALSVPHAIEKYAERRYDPDEVESGWHGWRAKVNAERIELPSEAELLISQSDDDLDPSEPRVAHFLERRGPDGEVRVARREFAAWLQRCVEAKDPMAVVRFGDGEAQLLEAEGEDAESIAVAIRKLSRQGAGTFTAEDVLEVKPHVGRAFEEADVLGILPDDDFSETGKMWLERLGALYAERKVKGRAPATLACCLLNHDVVEALPEILAGHPVSVISCRDVRPVLEGEWGLQDVRVYQVPSQYLMRDVDGPYEAAMHEEPMWPDAYLRVDAELTVREQGEVFLVGAGVFGKDLCIRVKELGGIALDLGSALDTLAGKLTRGPRRRVLELYAGGATVSDIVADLREVYGADVSAKQIEEFTSEAWRLSTKVQPPSAD